MELCSIILPYTHPNEKCYMSKCVLLVDDEEDVLAVTRMGLEMSAGWKVLTATSGKEAVAIATEHQPDVILLDWMMPEMDGRATL